MTAEPLALLSQLIVLVLLAVPVASVSWTMTHEEVFAEWRNWCVGKSKRCRKLYQRKFFYLFTCEYCLSHWISLIAIIATGFRLVEQDWRGFVIALFALVWVANVYMSLFGRLRLDIKQERHTIAAVEQGLKTGGRPTPPPEPRAPQSSHSQS